MAKQQSAKHTKGFTPRQEEITAAIQKLLEAGENQVSREDIARQVRRRSRRGRGQTDQPQDTEDQGAEKIDDQFLGVISRVITSLRKFYGKGNEERIIRTLTYGTRRYFTLNGPTMVTRGDTAFILSELCRHCNNTIAIERETFIAELAGVEPFKSMENASTFIEDRIRWAESKEAGYIEKTSKQGKGYIAPAERAIQEWGYFIAISKKD